MRCRGARDRRIKREAVMHKRNYSQKKIPSFEEAVKKAMGKRWTKISKDDRTVIKEMSKCQEGDGRPIGSAVPSDERIR